MALKNRTEAKAVVTAWAAILDLEATHKPDLRDEILNNCLFRKDVSDSQVASGTTKTLDFDGFDYIEVAQSNNVAYTLNNILQGEIKYLKITKTAAQTVSYINGTDVSVRKAFINATTVVIYRIINKDATIYLESINIDNDLNSAGYVEKKLDIGDWNMNTTPVLGIAHGLTAAQAKTIIVIGAGIRDDADAVRSDLLHTRDATGLSNAGVGSITSTVVNLAVITGLLWQTSVDYNGTGFSRGELLIKYIP